MRRCQRKENSCRNAEKKLFSAFFEHYYNVKESSAFTHICKFPSRHSLAYSSGSSMASEAYDKAVEKVAKEAMLATRRDDIRLAEDSKKWIQDPKHKASKREKDYAIKRLDGLIRKIETAMEKVVIRITKQLKQPEKKKAVVEEIKKEVKPSIRERLAQNVAKIQREEAERKQLKKGKSHSSDLEM